MDEVSGVIEKIVYSDEEKNYSVIKIKSDKHKELLTLVGALNNIGIGSVITAQGTWNTNVNFGKQFNVETWEESLPADVYGIEKYLGSGLIKGIGPKYAKLVVDCFGIDTFEIIESFPTKLYDVPKLGKKRADLIIKSWVEQKYIKNLMIFLQQAGVGASFGQKIYKIYGKESLSKIKENPYRLIDEVYGVGFKTADSIAQKLGFDLESYNRCRAGIFYILEYVANSEGHCYLPFDELINKSSKILKIEDTKIIMTYDAMVSTGELIVENEKVYLSAFYYSEAGLTKRIKNIMNFPRFKKYDDSEIDEQIKNIQKQNKIVYDDTQIKAIKTMLNSNFTVITGGAGVGKSTVTKAIIDIFKNFEKRVILTAPTGRAAKRMTEITQIESKTIHRLLEARKNSGFNKNEDNKIIGDVLIVDEASMIDLILIYNLFKAVPDSMTIILIGDVNQLPSVGPGNVLKDIINSNSVPVIKLTQIYRQARTSNIILNSHKINNGELIDFNYSKDSDFFYIQEKEPEKCANLITELCSRRLPKYYNVNPVTDIQVLSPMKRGVLGTDNLNRLLQFELNKTKISIKYGSMEFKLGDKVMQIKNNYDKDIFNGDIGKICTINEHENTLEVDFDSRIIKYDSTEFDELNLAYACTIHKSQGAEYPIVIIPVSYAHRIMLERNLFYTGVTRARKVCVIVGEKTAINYAIQNNNSRLRYTNLEFRLNIWKK